MKREIIFGLMVFSSFFLFLSCGRRVETNMMGSGVLEATEITVSAQMAGQIIDLAVDEGDTVSQGQLVATIDTERVVLQREQLLAALQELEFNILNAGRLVELAKTDLQNVEKKYNRIKTLFREKSATQQQYDDIETAYRASSTKYRNAKTSLQALAAKKRQLEAKIRLVQSQLDDARIVAPVAGTILEKYKNRGEIVTPAGPVVTIADLNKMWLKVYVSEKELGKVKINDRVKIGIDTFPDRTFPGRVSWISPKAEFTPKNVQTQEARADLVYAVKIDVDNSDGIFKIGMPADVYW